MLEQTGLKELERGDIVDHYLLINRLDIRTTKTGKEYLSLMLQDKSIALNANVWENFQSLLNSSKLGDVVKVNGIIEEFQGSLQIRISKINLLSPSDKISPVDFLPKSEHELDKMVKEFENRIDKISNNHLKSLLGRIFSGERFTSFTLAPAGKSWHHGYIHGLIEHTLELIRICDLMSDFHPEINRDLLISGAMLHDFGKTEELKYDSAFEYTDRGKLLGHIVIAAIIISEEAKSLPDFPTELKNNLIHLVISHQGKLEYASPVVPKTIEAIALYQADELSAKVNAYKNALSIEKKSERGWTRFITLAQTDLYNHELSPEQEEKVNNTLFD
ncbi:MAG: HD domain-containing protein [Ignavibacteria bacterium]|nr:HD domain-containing protein [Ignavibacteria bacterium]